MISLNSNRRRLLTSLFIGFLTLVAGMSLTDGKTANAKPAESSKRVVPGKKAMTKKATKGSVAKPALKRGSSSSEGGKAAKAKGGGTRAGQNRIGKGKTGKTPAGLSAKAAAPQGAGKKGAGKGGSRKMGQGKSSPNAAPVTKVAPPESSVFSLEMVLAAGLVILVGAFAAIKLRTKKSGAAPGLHTASVASGSAPMSNFVSNLTAKELDALHAEDSMNLAGETRRGPAKPGRDATNGQRSQSERSATKGASASTVSNQQKKIATSSSSIPRGDKTPSQITVPRKAKPPAA